MKRSPDGDGESTIMPHTETRLVTAVSRYVHDDGDT